MSDFTPHRFNSQVAEVYGLVPALAFQYVCLRSRTSQDNRFVSITTDELAAQYPYLSRATVARAFRSVVYPGKETPNLVFRKKVDGVYLYAPTVKDDPALDRLHSFDAAMAVKVGIVPAIIHNNVTCMIKHNWKRKAERVFRLLDAEKYQQDLERMWMDAFVYTYRAAAHVTTIAKWVKLHPYVSHRTAERGFSCLQDENLLQNQRGKHSKPVWYMDVESGAEFVTNFLNFNGTLNVPATLRQLTAILRRLTANLRQKLPISRSGSKLYVGYVKDIISKGHVKDGDGFAAASLAGARSAARSASNGATPSAAELSESELRRLTGPTYPEVRTKVCRDMAGSPCARRYQFKPKPADDDYDLYVDDLPAGEREKFLAGS